MWVTIKALLFVCVGLCAGRVCMAHLNISGLQAQTCLCPDVQIGPVVERLSWRNPLGLRQP